MARAGSDYGSGITVYIEEEENITRSRRYGGWFYDIRLPGGRSIVGHARSESAAKRAAEKQINERRARGEI